MLTMSRGSPSAFPTSYPVTTPPRGSARTTASLPAYSRSASATFRPASRLSSNIREGLSPPSSGRQLVRFEFYLAQHLLLLPPPSGRFLRSALFARIHHRLFHFALHTRRPRRVEIFEFLVYAGLFHIDWFSISLIVPQFNSIPVVHDIVLEFRIFLPVHGHP